MRNSIRARFNVLCYAKVLAAAAAVIGVTALGGCSTSGVLSSITPHKVEVIQGNFVSKEMVAALKPGMSKDEVGEVLGTPLLISVFHADRWDYVFTIRRQGVEPQARRLTVFFKGDAMTRYEADPMPTEAEFVNSIAAQRLFGSVPKLEISEQEKQEFGKRKVP
jgi:outer membrane protein assembly factor BamE